MGLKLFNTLSRSVQEFSLRKQADATESVYRQAIEAREGGR